MIAGAPGRRRAAPPGGPDVAGPETGGPNAGRPDVGMLGADRPDTGRPEIGTPDIGPTGTPEVGVGGSTGRPYVVGPGADGTGAGFGGPPAGVDGACRLPSEIGRAHVSTPVTL